MRRDWKLRPAAAASAVCAALLVFWLPATHAQKKKGQESAESLRDKRSKEHDRRPELNPGFTGRFDPAQEPADARAQSLQVEYAQALEQARSMPQYSVVTGKHYPSEKELTASSLAAAASLPNWTSLGPNNIGGRTDDIVIDPTNPNVMYVASGSHQGLWGGSGVWKTTDGGATWKTTTDSLPALAIYSLEMDPADHNTLYAGSGYNGIFKTTNAGASWTQLPSINNTGDSDKIQDIVVSHNNHLRVYAATYEGVWRSTNGGTSWTQVLGGAGFNTDTRRAWQLVVRRDQATDYLLASMGGVGVQGKVYRNTDAGGAGTWQEVTDLTESGTSSIWLAVAPSSQGTIYAITNNNSGHMHAFYRSTDGGANFTARVRATNADKWQTIQLVGAGVIPEVCSTNTTHSASRGGGGTVVAVDPVNPNRVWAAGVDIWRTDDGGATWGFAGSTGPSFIHVDHYNIAFHPGYNGTTNQKMFSVNDGGVFRTDNASAAVSSRCAPQTNKVTWQRAANYPNTQFYDGAVYADGSVVGGTQDNGAYRRMAAAGVWQGLNDPACCDNFKVAVNPNDTNVIYTLGLDQKIYGTRSANAPDPQWGEASADIGENLSFESPIFVDPGDPLRVWSGKEKLWRSTDGGNFWTQASAPLTGTPPQLTAVAVAPTDANFMLAGTRGGFIHRTSVGLTSTSATVWPGTQLNACWVSALAFDPTNKNIAYAACRVAAGAGITRVWRSTNAGANWTPVNGTGAGTLPDVAVRTLVVDPTNPSRLFVGTDIGVFTSTDSGAQWAREVTGFGNTTTTALRVARTNGTTSLFAFTYGRSAWRATVAGSPFLALGTVTPAAVGGDGDASIDPGESGRLTVQLKNTGGAAATGVSAQLASLTAGVSVTTAASAYPNLAAGGSGVNATQFAFNVASTVPCGTPLSFKLTVTYAGGGSSPQVFNFTVPTGTSVTKTVSYGGAAVTIPDNAPGVDIPLTVSGFTGKISDLNFKFGGTTCTAADGATTVGLNHTFVGDLKITLKSPQGTVVTLMDRPGTSSNSGNNFCNTVLDDDTGGGSIQSISATGAPFTGTFKPANPLSAFDGQNPNGTWTLNVTDLAGGDFGNVRAFSLIINSAECGAPATASIKGRVTTAGTTTGLAGVTMTLTSPTPAGFTPRTVQTTAAGDYTFANLPRGRSYTLKPSKTNYTFTPASKSYTNLTTNQTAQNFTAALKKYVISGTVKLGTAAMPGVTVTLTSPTPAGFTPRTATTGSTGAYSFASVPAGRNYVVTPTRTGYQFNPANKSLPNLSANQVVNFLVKVYSISGRVTRTGTTTGIASVTMTLTSPSPANFPARSVPTNSTGNYTFTNVPAGRNYTLKPTKTGFTFAPATRSFTNLSANVPAGASSNFTGTGP